MKNINQNNVKNKPPTREAMEKAVQELWEEYRDSPETRQKTLEWLDSIIKLEKPNVAEFFIRLKKALIESANDLKS